MGHDQLYNINYIRAPADRDSLYLTGKLNDLIFNDLFVQYFNYVYICMYS